MNSCALGYRNRYFGGEAASVMAVDFPDVDRRILRCIGRWMENGDDRHAAVVSSDPELMERIVRRTMRAMADAEEPTLRWPDPLRRGGSEPRVWVRNGDGTGWRTRAQR